MPDPITLAEDGVKDGECRFESALDEEPTAAELAEIEDEWPLIAAELDLLDAEIAVLSAGSRVSPLHHRRVRRAERRVAEVSREMAAQEVTTLLGRAVA